MTDFVMNYLFLFLFLSIHFSSSAKSSACGSQHAHQHQADPESHAAVIARLHCCVELGFRCAGSCQGWFCFRR